jgi:hypothetical protein
MVLVLSSAARMPRFLATNARAVAFSSPIFILEFFPADFDGLLGARITNLG